MSTRWTKRTPRIARVTRRAARPVCTAGHGAHLDRLGERVDAVATRVEEYNTHIGHVHATAIGDALESQIERRELSTRVANLGASSTKVAEALKVIVDNVVAHDEARDAKITNLVDVMADLVLAVNGIACRETEVEGA
jgi:hypothetical protein